MKQELTAKQEAFVQAYLEVKNASEAYRRAYNAGKMKPATINRNAKALMDNSKIATRLEALQSEVAERVVEKTSIDRAWIMERLQKNVELAMQLEYPTDDQGKVIGQAKYQGAVANRALELLGQEIGMFVKRNEFSGPNGGPIPVQATAPDYSRLKALFDGEGD